jgi:DNA-binding NtrC family response regulator
MEKKFSELTIHQKLELVIKEMVDREVQLKEATKEFEKIFIENTSRKYRGNKTKMAKAMGIHRNTLHSRAKSLRIKKLF